MAKRNYREGDWFAVPLREDGYAIGVVARANRDGVLLGYFFGPRRSQLPSLNDVRALIPDDAVLVSRFGHLGLVDVKWPNLGQVDDWDRNKWKMPAFCRYEELSGRSFLVFYDDNDPNRQIRREKVPLGESDQAPKDGVSG